jgi:hypothetical protein
MGPLQAVPLTKASDTGRSRGGMVTTGPAYPAARVAAGAIHAHFAGLSGGRAVPDLAAIEAIISACFWASLRREESYVPKISLAFLRPENASRALLLERTLSLDPEALARLAPAVERPGIHLGVSGSGTDLHVWGTTRTLPGFCFTLEVIAPGLLVVKQSRDDDAAKYLNIAVLQGEQVKVLDQSAARVPDCPNFLASLLGLDPPRSAGDVNILVQLAISMRAHARGGSLLVVPPGSSTWRNSILHPIPYPVAPAFRQLAELADTRVERDRRWQEELQRTVEVIAGLTAVDGATVLTSAYELLAFGAKIGRPDGRPRVEQVMVTEPIQGSEPVIVHPSQLGGTRHLSAAQFAMDQHDALALVASQDGRFTLFAWSDCAEMVQGHRVETLLL